MRPERIEPGPGQESVWDYPRPPRLEPTNAHIVVKAGDHVIADSTNALRILETSQPPAFYIPTTNVDMDALTPSLARTFCEWKGEASYFDLAVGEQTITQVAWCYNHPTPRFAQVVDHLAFYAQKLTCSVDGEVVDPNDGSFYGGWITSTVVGPFKGGAGSQWW